MATDDMLLSHTSNHSSASSVSFSTLSHRHFLLGAGGQQRSSEAIFLLKIPKKDAQNAAIAVVRGPSTGGGARDQADSKERVRQRWESPLVYGKQNSVKCQMNHPRQ